MRIRLLFIIIMPFLCSCNTTTYLPGFDFELFKHTPVEKLAKAVEREDVDKIKSILLDTSIKVDFQEPKFGNTLLMLAVANNKMKAVEQLMKCGANPNKKDRYDDENALEIACDCYTDHCDVQLVKLLLDFGADPNIIQNIKRNDTTDHTWVVQTALMTAVKYKCLEVVKLLVDHGADINVSTYYEGYGAITSAIIQDNLAIARYLIIEKQAKIPQYCYIRNMGDNNEQKLTVPDLLNEQKYDHGTSNYFLQQEILNYLKKKDSH